MQPIQWVFIIGGVASGIAVALCIAAYVRRRLVSVAPLCAIREGAFSQLAAKRLGSPDSMLRVLQVEGLAVATKDIESTVFASGRIHSASTSAAGISSSATATAAWGAAGIDGVTPALEVWSRRASVDEHVFQEKLECMNPEQETWHKALRQGNKAILCLTYEEGAPCKDLLHRNEH